MTAAPTPGARLEERYGRTSRSRHRRPVAVITAALLLVLAAVVWGVLTGVGGISNTTDPQTIGYTVPSDSTVTVGWQVTGDASLPLICAIEAQDSIGVVVGLVEVRLPVTGQPARSGTTTLLTTRRADTGLIQSCRRA